MRRWGWWLGLGLPLTTVLVMGAAILLAPDPSYRVAKWMALGRYGAHDETIRRVAQESGVDPLLLKAMAWRTSAFDPKKVGPDGGRGLLQISEAQARDWAATMRIETFMFTDLFDPETNLRIGASVLAAALKDGRAFDAPEPYALIACQAGRAQTQTWSQDTHSTADLLRRADPATRQYVESVMSRWRFYRAHGW